MQGQIVIRDGRSHTRTHTHTLTLILLEPFKHTHTHTHVDHTYTAGQQQLSVPYSGEALLMFAGSKYNIKI